MRFNHSTHRLLIVPARASDLFYRNKQREQGSEIQFSSVTKVFSPANRWLNTRSLRLLCLLLFILLLGGVNSPAASDPRAANLEIQSTKPDPQRHWAFQPLQSIRFQAVRNRRWPRNALDHFILSRLESAGHSPGLAADKRTLIRRATFDLTGLPPTPREVDAFLRDTSPDAFAKLIERLLASPHYGEHWGRHWLDVARYADTAGESADYPIPQARFYRDYVIASFNHDKPYDQFLREQIAGDLLPAADSDTAEQHNERIIATGFVALSRRFGVEGSSPAHLIIEDTLETTGRAVLGLSLSCARCHDHKHDPVSMEDYYALYGIFASTRYPHPGSETRSYQTNFVPLAATSAIEILKTNRTEKLKALDAELDRLDAEINLLKKERLTTLKTEAARKKLNEEAEELDSTLPLLDTAYAIADDQPANARLQRRGEPANPGDEIPRRFLKLFGGEALPAGYLGSGRLELARWLTEAARPLTARVMVNRIWKHHFGHGLVATPNDFGTHGQPPSHPELLDWLAQEFINSGWSMKTIHRLVMQSATYQQSSSGFEIGESMPAHLPRRRLAAEELRDALLFVSGELDLEPAGEHPFPAPHTWDFSQHIQFNDVYETRHRSVYLMQQRIRKHPFLAAFDGPDANASTGERPVTTTPLQALFMMNDPFAHEQAERFAERLLRESPDDRRRIDLAHRLAFGRPARPEEIRDGLAYLQAFQAKLITRNVVAEKRTLQAWASYARALLGSNEFLFVD